MAKKTYTLTFKVTGNKTHLSTAFGMLAALTQGNPFSRGMGNPASVFLIRGGKDYPLSAEDVSNCESFKQKTGID